jgi:hypothetical protein
LDAEKLCCGYNICSLYRITQTYINRVFQRRLLIDLEVIEMFVCAYRYSVDNFTKIFVTDDDIFSRFILDCMLDESNKQFIIICHGTYNKSERLSTSIAVINRILSMDGFFELVETAFTNPSKKDKDAHYHIKTIFKSDFVECADIEPSEKFYNVLEEVFNKMNVKFEYDDDKRYIHVSCVD